LKHYDVCIYLKKETTVLFHLTNQSSDFNCRQFSKTSGSVYYCFASEDVQMRVVTFILWQHKSESASNTSKTATRSKF
jgi:hypothetical protein